MHNENKTFKNIHYYEKKEDKILCSYNILFNRIRLSTGFFKKLNEDEAHFFINHEVGHKKDRWLYLFVIILSSVNFFMFIITVILSLFVYIDPNFLSLFLVFIIITGLILIIFYRYLEYRADEFAAKKVHYKHFISAVEKMKKENYPIFVKFLAALIHPSIERRIDHILKIKK